MRPAAGGEASARAACSRCRHYAGESSAVEGEVPGLAILSSAYGSVRADTAYCRRHDVFFVPLAACPEFSTADVASGASY